MTSYAYHRCTAHRRNRNIRQVIGHGTAERMRPADLLGREVCPTFVRNHFHEGDRCLKWQGIRPSDPLTCGQDDCSRPLQPVTIQGTYSATVECGQLCRDATGRTCRCSCAGRNHGADE